MRHHMFPNVPAIFPDLVRILPTRASWIHLYIYVAAQGPQQEKYK